MSAEAPGAAEEVDGELELISEVRPVAPARSRSIVIGGVELTPVQAATAVAATGFMAGAATVAVGRARSERKRRKRERKAARRRKQLMQVVASRSFLVDVHLLGRD